MARKTTGNTTTNRSRKTEAPAPPAAVQVAPEVPRNGKPASVLPRIAPVNVEEEIRRRAYELYLERRATAGGDSGNSGNKDQDWLIAEREILSRHGSHHQHSA
ncbi:MAG: DUF2934 domain-containing protein [Terriglobales bacterium]